MSQSPLARTSRKSLSAFARPPSKLSRSESAYDLASGAPDSPSPASQSQSSSGASRSGSASKPRYTDSGTSTNNANAFSTPTREPGRRFRQSLASAAGITAGNADSPLHTPTTRLTYSPFATPPAGMSKSSSMPFDMAANARAAREAERRRSIAPPPPPADGSPKRKRFVRRKPLWKRVIESPANLLDTAMFHLPTSVDEVLPPARFANPIALALFAVHWLLLAPLRAPKEELVVLRQGQYRTGVDDRWGRFEEETKATRRGLAGTRMALIFTLILLALSIANATYLFTRFRTYDLQLRSGNDPLASPHASPIPAPRLSSPDSTAEQQPREAQTDANGGWQKYAGIAGRWLVIVLKWSFFSLLSALGARAPASSVGFGTADRIQSLRVWEPPEFCLAFFCAFPPSAPLLSYLLVTRHPFLTPIIHAATAALLSHLAASFTQLVKDRMILSAEVMREYDQRFVYKRVFAPKVDRGVGTSDREGILMDEVMGR